jgi:hypothetical protein
MDYKAPRNGPDPSTWLGGLFHKIGGVCASLARAALRLVTAVLTIAAGTIAVIWIYHQFRAILPRIPEWIY